jgi:toxin-antitoxin system PIN domain toxin
MILCDVNILVYASREDMPDHETFKNWLANTASSHHAYGISELAFSAYLRIVTNRAIFNEPTQLEVALTFVNALRDRRNSVIVSPGPRHWGIFVDLCRKVNAKGNIVPDAYLAALAIESGSDWITTDRGFARFPGLRWRHPLDD